jgi:tetratricopeptide (TPR) repeat protein
MPVFPESIPAAPGEGLLISACLIVKDEARHLGRCLDSLRSVADEVIVVDTGSSDGTPELARAAGARVIPIVWERDFSRARNVGLDAARGAWVLVLDADEFLTPAAQAELRALARAHTPAGGLPAIAFRLLQTSSVDGGPTGMWVKLVRLFPRRPPIRYEWPIHEQVETSLARAGIPVIDSGIPLIHTGYADPAQRAGKQRRNLAILAAQAAAASVPDALTCFLIGGAHLDLGNYEAAYASYAECDRRCSPQDELGRGARVRLATCLVKLRRFEAAIAIMPPPEDPAWHPELLILRGTAEAALGRPEAARPWYERALACLNLAFVPPCDLAVSKTEALLGLGTYWKARGRPALAVALLRAARDRRERGADFTASDLAEIYRAHGAA